MRLLRRVGWFLFPEAATCSTCGLGLRERVRRPCPRCGDTRRTHIRAMVLDLGTKDEMG